MVEAECQGCGAIFTTDSKMVPAALICSCQHKDFKINLNQGQN
jgi:hypothetical protein